MHLARWIIGISMNMGPTQSPSTASIYRRKKGTLNWQTTSLFGDYGAEKQLLYSPHFVWWITLVIIVIVDTRKSSAEKYSFTPNVRPMRLPARLHRDNCTGASPWVVFISIPTSCRNRYKMCWILNLKQGCLKDFGFFKVSLIYILDIRRGWRIKD